MVIITIDFFCVTCDYGYVHVISFLLFRVATSQVYLQNCTVVPPTALMVFGGDLAVSHATKASCCCIKIFI